VGAPAALAAQPPASTRDEATGGGAAHTSQTDRDDVVTRYDAGHPSYLQIRLPSVARTHLSQPCEPGRRMRRAAPRYYDEGV